MTQPAGLPERRADELAHLEYLGLTGDATPDDVEARESDIRAFLASAPESLRGWAERAGESASAAAGVHGVHTALGPDEEVAAPVAAGGAGASLVPGSEHARRSVPWALLLLLLVPLIVWGVYKMGSPTPAPENAMSQVGVTAQPTAPATLDQAKVGELEAKVEKDPAGVDSMRQLGRMYHEVGDWAKAADWQQRIVADNPEDVDARLALGTALFNQDDLKAAEVQWLKAAELDPTQAEPHYNLGFLYLSQDPPALDKVDAEWGKVVSLAPDSDMAKTVSAHMGMGGGSTGRSSSSATPSASGSATSSVRK